MEEENYINPFDTGNPLYVEQPTSTNLGLPNKPTPQTKLVNPFDRLVKQPSALNIPNINDSWKTQDTNTPIRVSTSASQDYIKRGFNINDLDLNPKLEQDLSSTQSRMDRLTNNLKVAGANLVSMAVVTGLSNPLSTGEDDLNGGIAKDLFDWSTGVARENRTFETANDESDNIWQQLTNWVNPLGNSTKGLGKLLESTAFGLGAGAGIAFQEAVVSFATDGIGTIPALANNIKRVLNSAKYLDRALEASGMAVKGARNLERIVDTGLVSEKMSSALKNIYQSQVGAYSEALFEGLEGKESMKQQLLQDFKLNRGYDAIGKDLEDIEKASHELGVTRMNLNRALLSYSNISQFNSVFKTFNPIKETAEELAKKYGNKLLVQEGKVIVDQGSDLLKSAWFNKGVGKVINKSLTGAYNASKGEVMSEAIQEGREEGVQFLIDKTLNNYYSWKYKGENKSFSDALIEGTKDLFTKEGIESIFTGALAGGGQSVAFNYLSKLNKDYKVNKEEFATNQKTLANQYNQFGKSFENLSDVTKKKIGTLFNHSSVNGTLHDKRTIMNASSGTSEIKNNPEDLEQYNQANMHELYSLALPYVQNGNVDILKEQFSKYKELDEKGFKDLFNVDTKDKNKLVDYYLDEFDKIDEAFARSDSAFDLHFKGKDLASLASNQLYKEMKQELAFALYNNDNLIQDSKELEAKLVDYPKVINEYGLNFPKQIKENKEQIKFLEKNLEITPDDDITKDKIKGLQNHNEYLEKVMSGSKDISQTEYVRELNNNIIIQHFKSLGKDLPEAFKQTEITNDILGTVYHLAKIKDRINYQQDKINKILYSNNPIEFFKNAQIEFENLVEQDKQSKLEKPEVIQDKEEVAPEPELPTVYDNYTKTEEIPYDYLVNLVNKYIAGKPFSKEEQDVFSNETEEINKIFERIKENSEKTDEVKPVVDVIETDPEPGINNLLSKVGSIPFMIDKDGNILEDEKSFIERAKVVYSFLFNPEDKYKNITYKLIDVKDVNNDGVSYSIENNTIYRKPVRKVIGIFHNETPIGSFILDKDTLKVNTILLGKMIKEDLSEVPTELYEFLTYLKQDSQKDLFNKINKSNTLLKSGKSIDDLVFEHTGIKNTMDSINSFVVNDKLNEQGLAKFIEDNDLLESRIHINGKYRKPDLIPLVGSALEDKAIIVNVNTDNTFTLLTQENASNKKDIILQIENHLKDKPTFTYNRKLLFYKQKHTSGAETLSFFNVPTSDARLFKEELNKTLSTEEDFKNRTSQLHYVLNDGVTNVKLGIYERDDKSGLELTINLIKGQETIPYSSIKNIPIKEMSSGEFLDLIERNLKTLQDIKGNDIVKVKAIRIDGGNEQTLYSKDVILIPSYAIDKAPLGQVFTTSYLQFKPLEKALENKDVITSIETDKELPSFLSEKDENIAEFNAKTTAITDKEKAQISEEKDVKDFNSTFGAIWDEPTPTVSVIPQQEELPLQVGQFYVDAGLPKIIESISYDKVSDKYVVNGESFSKGTLEYMSENTNQTKYKNDYDKLVKKQKESNTNLELKPGNYYVFGGKVGIINTIEKNGNEYIINGNKLNTTQYQYILDSTQKGLEARYKPSGITEQTNLVEPEKPVILEEENKVDSLFKYLETIGVFPTKKLNNVRTTKGDEVFYDYLTNKLKLFIGKNSNENGIVLSNVNAKIQAGIFEIKPPKLRVKEKVSKIDNQELYNKIKKCL